MASLVDFFGKNAEKLPEKEIIVSNRFKDNDGNPIPWKIKALDAATQQRIRSEAMDMNVNDQKKVNVKFNSARMNQGTVAASVVYPDLKDKALQDYYGVATPSALVGVMLSDDEFERLLEAVNSLSAGTDPGTIEEEAKN
jgi:hypothetical protein